MRVLSLHVRSCCFWFGLTLTGWAQDGASADVTALATENRELRQRVDALEHQLDELRRQVGAWRKEERARNEAQARREAEPIEAAAFEPPPRSLAQRVILSGDLAVSYFDGGSEGQHASGQFKLDDAKLHLDDPTSARGFLFMTGDLISEGFQAFLRKHNRPCLPKPFALRELRAAVAKLAGNG